MTLHKRSPCKVNLLLNILGRRPDGFHELETVMHPVPLYDDLTFTRRAGSVEMTCNEASLPTDSRNLVFRAAELFLATAGIKEGVRLHLEKRIPLAAGLGGGSGNAAVTLLGMNELFGKPLSPEQLSRLAGSLGSDVPFFLQEKPALATGRGEHVEALEFFPLLKGTALVLVHPGFGISSAWAYQQLHRFPKAQKGEPGRAAKLIAALSGSDMRAASTQFYNSLEAPALEKYPLLVLFQEFFREQGALATLMSGSGSTTFGLAKDESTAHVILERFKGHFGSTHWTAVCALKSSD